MSAPSSHPPAPSRRGTRALLVSTLVLAAGCGPADEPPRQPLSAFAAESPSAAASPSSPATQARPTSAHPVEVAPLARAALDRGNAAFRRQDYGAAMRDYRAAAAAEPTSAAPFYGVYMVAKKVGNKTLADSAMREIQRLSGTTLMTPDVEKLHRAPPGEARAPR